MVTDYTFRGMTVPANLIESLTAYAETGRPTGGFLHAVIDNNLKDACGRADESSAPIIPAIVGFLYNYCPSICWGFAGAHDAWVEEKRKERADNGRIL